jgi:peptide chain release factor subunit 1
MYVDLDRREDGLDRDGAHGLALFVSSPDDLFVPLPLPGAVTDGVRLGDELYVTPLIDHVDEDDTLIAVVSRERGQIFRLRGGRLDEIVDETEEQPGRHDQGGWSQARYQRHIEHLVQRHLKTVGTAIDRRVRGAGLQIVVVMPEEMRSAFAARLSHEARSAIIGWVTAEAHARPAELLRAVRPLLEEADAERHEAVMQRFEEALGRGEHAASGWQATVDAAADARVETLLLEEGADRAVWQCPVCRRAGAEDGTCPVDLAPLERRADGADALVHVVLATGGSVLRVGRGALGGSEVGALLRF